MKQSTTNNGKTKDKNATHAENNQPENGSLLEKFFIDGLKDIYYAEKRLETALGEMQQAATTEELEDAFGAHQQQTRRHIQRLEKVFQSIDKDAEEETCEAMEGLLKEAKKIISDTKEGTMTRDVGLIIAAQKVEHYEIASYGGLLQLAITMKLDRAAELLDKTLREEEETDQRLTDIAESHINIGAEEENKYSWSKKKKAAIQ
jgi:ferritin-like metal-binding protein YciE